MTKPKLELVKPEAWIEEPDITHVMAAISEFHEKFEVARNADIQELYLKLVDEEHEEWIEDYYSLEAFEYEELKELADLLYVTAGLAYQMGYKITHGTKYVKNEVYDVSITDLVSDIVTGQRDKKTLCNLIYCMFGYADAMGWDLHEAFKRVHASNLSKLDVNGKPVRREDGKVLKGLNYQPPSLEDLTNGK